MRVHFIGCGGVSMRRLMSLTALRHEVSGSDAAIGGHSAQNVHGADMVVYSSAITPDNPEYAEAKRLNVPLVGRAEYLAALASGFRQVIAVAGTHGKTTTTAMLACALSAHKPTVHVGGEPIEPFADESDALFITEACEYGRSFLTLSPSIGVVLNAELDHTDYYRDQADYLSAFIEFGKRSDVVVYNGDRPELKGLFANGLSFGLGEHNDIRASELTVQPNIRFNVTAFGNYLCTVTLSSRGLHNALNALAAVAAALTAGASATDIVLGLTRFKGVKRRMQLLGAVHGAEVYSDYAHHPTEVRATIAALRASGRRVVVFEPHTYSRTRDLMNELKTAFGGVDEVIIAPVYAARESVVTVTAERLAAEIKNVPASSMGSYAEINAYLKRTLKTGDVVVFMGAGDVHAAASALAEEG